MSKDQRLNMKKANQHVIPVGNGWAVKAESNTKFTFIADSKKEAVAYARGLAKHNNAELIVYGKDGKIADRDSYIGKDRKGSKK